MRIKTLLAGAVAALALTGPARTEKLFEAAEAYRAAFVRYPDYYPAINAATLYLLAGDEAEHEVCPLQTLVWNFTFHLILLFRVKRKRFRTIPAPFQHRYSAAVPSELRYINRPDSLVLGIVPPRPDCSTERTRSRMMHRSYHLLRPLVLPLALV